MTYTHFSQSERYQIERWLQQGLLIIQISRLLDNGAACTCALLVQRMLLEDRRLPLLSVTVDRGGEYRDLPELLGSKLYLCDPQRPNQRGTNENTIGLIRQYIPNRTPIRLINTQELAQIQIEFNNRPRQCLGFKPLLRYYSNSISAVALRFRSHEMTPYFRHSREGGNPQECGDRFPPARE
jgi:IS30 family transposase